MREGDLLYLRRSLREMRYGEVLGVCGGLLRELDTNAERLWHVYEVRPEMSGVQRGRVSGVHGSTPSFCSSFWKETFRSGATAGRFLS
jgi:hypothetical protein